MTAPGWGVHNDDGPPADPLDLASAWLPDDADPDRPRVTLSTVGTDGWPAARTVLLSAFDASGFAFHTSASSRKVAELAALPRATMTVLWPEATRQLVVRGDVVPDDAERSAAAWAARSEYLRRLAWANTDELAALDLTRRQAAWAAQQVPGQADSWVGYRVQPREMTFWTAHPEAPSRRVQYTRTPDGWTWRYRAG